MTSRTMDGMRIILVAALAACGGEQAPRPPSGPPPEAAVSALREGHFDAAFERARDNGHPQAAAVRAIARYQRAGETLIHQIGSVMEQAEGVHFFDHEQGRAVWTSFAAE